MAAYGPARLGQALWVLMMAVWLGALGYGLIWIWSLIAGTAPLSEVLMTSAWLILGIVAWIVALSMGRRRYWRR